MHWQCIFFTSSLCVDGAIYVIYWFFVLKCFEIWLFGFFSCVFFFVSIRFLLGKFNTWLLLCVHTSKSHIEWYMYNVPANQLSISLALFSQNRFRLYVLVVCRTHDEHLLSLKRTILAHTLSTKIAQLLIYSIRTYLSAQKHLTSESQMNESNNNNNNAHEFRTNFDVWLTLLPCVCLVFFCSHAS